MFKRLLPMRSPQENARFGMPRVTLAAYEAGEMDAQALPSLGQDLYETGVLPKLPARYFLLVEHLRGAGLIHTHGRAFH